MFILTKKRNAFDFSQLDLGHLEAFILLLGKPHMQKQDYDENSRKKLHFYLAIEKWTVFTIF